MAQADRLQELLEPVVVAMGYEVVGLEYLQDGRRATVRLYIDQPEGVTLDDCERVSRQVSAVLDVEDVIRSQYTLEISSPGLDRPLFTPEHYQRFAGATVQVRLYEPLQGRRKITGTLGGIEGEEVLVSSEGVEYRIPLQRIAKARLKPEFF